MPIAGIAVALLFLILAGGVNAHPGHENVLSTKQVLMRGRAVVSSLVRKEQQVDGVVLDDTWNQASDTATCRETHEHYLIAIDNRDAGKTLYLLFSVAGKYLRANFDGQFADITFSPYPLRDCT